MYKASQLITVLSVGFSHVAGWTCAHEKLQEIGHIAWSYQEVDYIRTGHRTCDYWHMHEATRRSTTYVLGIELAITGTCMKLPGGRLHTYWASNLWLLAHAWSYQEVDYIRTGHRTCDYWHKTNALPFHCGKFTSDWLHHGSGPILAKIGTRAVPYWRHRR